jgi:membrane associated rhomboid family serine protease
VLCLVIFWLQIQYQVTESLMYYPETWNPLKMLTSSLAHGGWMHIFGNLIFFMAFAPAVEALIGSKLRFIWIIVFISLSVGISYTLSILMGNSEPLPSLGLSGVVMGMIGLSAYLMPTARIKVFCWFFVFWKTFYVPVWVLAIFYLGWDMLTMITADDYHDINVVAHVFGGVAGYMYGFLWLKERKEETREELDEEIEAMKISQKFGKAREKAHRYHRTTEKSKIAKDHVLDLDKFMSHIYQYVKTHRDDEAIYALLSRYDLSTPMADLEVIYKRIEVWGTSRTMLCFARLIIHHLDTEKRYGRAIVYIEKCQDISPHFVLPDLAKTLFYARFAIETGKLKIARNLVEDSERRYGSKVNSDQCREFELKIAKENVDILL